jgi:hypothetical protein
MCNVELMTILTVTQATKNFPGTLRRMTAKQEAVVLKRGRRTVAIMLPPAMLAVLEDLRDVQEADRVMKAVVSGHEKLIPWEDIKAKARL